MLLFAVILLYLRKTPPKYAWFTNVTVILAMLHPLLNPLFYLSSNQIYRAQVKKLFSAVLEKFKIIDKISGIEEMDVQSSKATKSEKNNTNINISTHTCDLHVSAKKGGSFKVQLPVSQTAPADECRCEVPMNTDTKRRKN